ncbi:hypothetical protein ANN_15301 [Periplaneta americana]|uniref:Reverse transcriptase domain-containing protein n=1 Tax=Periplaneta americana TaxID=6978 RepID=A0ABQ8SG18_PERAM|nr:hypothetical protein ANN_15301 [Periplaneta americana]
MILQRILNRRLYSKLQEEQFGFRKGKELRNSLEDNPQRVPPTCYENVDKALGRAIVMQDGQITKNIPERFEAAVLSVLLIIGNVELNPGPGDTEGRVYSDEVFQREWINYMKETREDRLKASFLLNKVASDIDTLVNRYTEVEKKLKEVIQEQVVLKSIVKKWENDSRINNIVIYGVEERNHEKGIDTGFVVLELLTKYFSLNLDISAINNAYRVDLFRRKKSEEGKPCMEEEAGTSEDAVWGAGAQTERTTSEGSPRRASENTSRRSDCGSTGKVSASEDQLIRMPHAVGSPGCARGSTTIWRSCAIPTDEVEAGDEQLIRGTGTGSLSDLNETLSSLPVPDDVRNTLHNSTSHSSRYEKLGTAGLCPSSDRLPAVAGVTRGLSGNR